MIPSPTNVTLIYSIRAGSPADSARRLNEVITQLRTNAFEADVVLTQSADDVFAATYEAVKKGEKLVLVCGGDGTVESAANAVIGTDATLGILPTGTRNNVARSLKIPLDTASAVSLLRNGSVQAIGAGSASSGGRQRWFLETFTVGLFSALYPHADAIQKGDLLRVGDLLATFFAAPAARFDIRVDDGELQIKATAHAVMGVNMPITGGNFRLANDITYADDHLDLFIYDRLDKLDMLVYGFDVLTGMAEDAGILRVRAKQLSVRSDPPLPVMADGFELGDGVVEVFSAPRSLKVIAGA